MDKKVQHRATLTRLRAAVGDVLNAQQDGLLYGGTIRLSRRGTPWVQVAPSVMTLWWPYAESPHVVLFRDVPCTLNIRILDWCDDSFALVTYDGDAEAVARWIDQVFRNVYNRKLGYSIDTEITDLADLNA